MKPLCFLDVDGVLNRLVGSRSLPSGRGSVLRPVEDARGKVESLSEVYEVVWASQWGPRAPLVWGKELGIGSDWPHLPYQGTKLPAIVRYAAGRPWAWVDDKAEPSEDGLIVVTDPCVGLTQLEVEGLCPHKF